MRILYAEDDDAIRYLIEILLKANGYDIVTAPDGATALQLLHTQPFDLIISDILMPKMDGFLFCRQVRADPQWDQLPFIFYSATYNLPADKAFAQDLGAAAFLTKPMLPAVFLRQLKRSISRAQSRTTAKPLLDEVSFLNRYIQRIGSKLESTHFKLDHVRDQLTMSQLELHQTRRALGVLTDHSSDAVLIVDDQAALLLLSPGARTLTGLADQHRQYVLNDLLPAQRCSALLSTLQATLPEPAFHKFNEVLLNGAEVMVTAHQIQYQSRPALLLVMRDLNSYVLEHSPYNLHSDILKNLQEGIMILNTDGKLLSINPAFTSITGYSATEVLGQPMHMLESERQDEAFYQRLWATLLTDGQWQGELWSRRKHGQIYPQWLCLSAIHNGNRNDVVFYVGIFSDISEHERSRQRIEHLAHYDSITDLPNRTLLNYRLNDAMQNAARNRSNLALLFIDLDHFKHINDTLGHPVGDLLLKQVAERLQANLRQVDTVSRHGGDEFLVILTDMASSTDVISITNKLITAIRTPYHIANQTLHITASVGISLLPNHDIDAAGLIQRADAALYLAKNDGRNNFKFYDKKLSTENEQRLKLEAALVGALERGELYLVYQPQVRMADQLVTGCEVLLRWHHPELGEVSPSTFIPIAEQYGYIHQIGDWVLRTACQQMARWQCNDYPPFSMSINLSALQFHNPCLVSSLQSLLNELELPPQCLELELTESVLMQDATATIDTLQQLKTMQIKLVIDDFGTGYSNLSYLKRFAVDKLKIDQSFVQALPDDANTKAIVQAILQIAASLQLIVVAEGVETPAQRDCLMAQGCLIAQGYLYARPMPAVAFEQFMRGGEDYPDPVLTLT